jgi:hypothetical protein
LLDNRAPPTQALLFRRFWRNRAQLLERRAKFKMAFSVKNVAIKMVFLIAINYYTCGIQNIDDIILIARFDDPGATCSHFCQRLG